MIRTFSRLVEEAKKKAGIVAGVPAADDPITALSVMHAQKEGIADFILYGDREKIRETLRSSQGNPADFEIRPADSAEKAAEEIVSLAREKKVNLILKGNLPTASLMKPVLDKEKGLRTGKLLSDVMIAENPRKEPECLLGISDGGLNILPNLQQKQEIVENAVTAFHKLGYSTPHVAILAAIETVKDSMPATLDAQALTRMNREGIIPGCRIYGPLALDIAVSLAAAQHKGISDEVAGNAHILIVPNIEAGNILGKSFTYYLNAPVSHVIMGATIPILIPSRNESDQDKFYSLALGTIIADR